MKSLKDSITLNVDKDELLSQIRDSLKRIRGIQNIYQAILSRQLFQANEIKTKLNKADFRDQERADIESIKKTQRVTLAKIEELPRRLVA